MPPSAEEFLSGEVFYRSNQSILGSTDELNSLDIFLKLDADSKLQKSQSRTALEKLKAIRHLNSLAFNLAVTHDSKTLKKFIDLSCANVHHDATYLGRKV
jgi:hypothetical protein